MVKKIVSFDIYIKTSEQTPTYSYVAKQKVMTNDKDSAQITFNLLDVSPDELSGSTASILLYMHDGSFFQSDAVTIDRNRVIYNMKPEETKHSGNTKVQMVLKKGSTQTASLVYNFEIESGLEKYPLTEVMIQDWTTLTAEAKAFVDQIEGFTLESFVENKMGQELANLEVNYATRLTGLESNDASLTAQLAQKANDHVVRKKSQLISLNDIDGEFLGAIQDGNGGVPITVESVPKNGSVTSKKTDFIIYGKNKFNPTATKDGFSLNSAGSESADPAWSLSEPMPVKQGETYSLTPKDSLFTYKRPAFFDSDMQFVSLIHAGTANYKINYTAPQDGFVQVPVPTVNKHQFSMTVTSESDGFQPFTLVGVDNLFVNPIKDESHVEKMDAIDFFENGFNILEQGIYSIGKFINDLAPTTIQTSASYNLYQDIPVRSGETLNYREFGSGKGIRFAIFYNSSGDFISGENHGTGGFQQGEIIVPAGAVKASVTVFEGESTRVLSRHSEVIEGQKDYQLKPSHAVGLSGRVIVNKLTHKRLIGFGDSINQGGGNVLNGKGRGHIEMIAEDNNMTFFNYSVGGATIAYREGYTNQIIDQINLAISNGETADYIVFNGLTNDASATPISRIGEMTGGYTDTLDSNTFAGAFENICRTLKLNWLGAKLIYVRVHNMSSRGTQQILYGEMAVKICKKYSIPVVDMYSEGGLNTQMIEMTNLYTNNSDSTHPNDLGYRTFYVPKIEAKMKSL